jgi:hypothetical protein
MMLRETRTIGTGDCWDRTESGIYLPDRADLGGIETPSLTPTERQPIALDLLRFRLATARGGTLFVETDGSVCPTGFPFKVHQLESALSDHAVRDARERKCDLGYLRQP